MEVRFLITTDIIYCEVMPYNVWLRFSFGVVNHAAFHGHLLDFQLRTIRIPRLQNNAMPGSVGPHCNSLAG